MKNMMEFASEEKKNSVLVCPGYTNKRKLINYGNVLSHTILPVPVHVYHFPK